MLYSVINNIYIYSAEHGDYSNTTYLAPAQTIIDNAVRFMYMTKKVW